MERQQGRRIDANVPSVVWTEANTTSAKWLWARHQNRYQLWIYCSVADLWPLERVTSRCHLISVTLSCSIPILPIPVLVIALCMFLFEVMRPKCKDIDHILMDCILRTTGDQRQTQCHRQGILIGLWKGRLLDSPSVVIVFFFCGDVNSTCIWTYHYIINKRVQSSSTPFTFWEFCFIYTWVQSDFVRVRVAGSSACVKGACDISHVSWIYV